MTMQEVVEQVAFMLGLPANENTENLQIEQAVNIAFRELKRYMKTPVDKTVPYSTRIDLKAVGINTVNVLYVQAAQPRLGLSLSSVESGNVFQVAASVNVTSLTGQSGQINIEPIMQELALSQVQNCLTTNFQWKYDLPNQVVYCTHRSPVPSAVTIRYVPIYEDVSEITDQTWIDYLVRMSEANMKKALGRSRSKYKIEGSNVTLDGDQLLAEANTELETIRNELSTKKSKLVVLN
ncbi:MAG: hypothetical protein NC320_03200 [Clostridium sp.]|nr:hypothetical protein [Clostridium sp.]